MSVRENIVAIVSTVATAAGERAREEGAEQNDVVRAVMRDARDNWLAPNEDEAFMGAVSALLVVFPEHKDALMQEARAIGDRSKMLSALMNGVPVDMSAWQPEEFPEPKFGLIETWREIAFSTTGHRAAVTTQEGPEGGPR